MTNFAHQNRVIKSTIKALLDAGHKLTVSYERGYDIDDLPIVASTRAADIFAAINAVDECHLFVHQSEDEKCNPVLDGQINNTGWVCFVLGNDGWDVINEYTVSMESLLAPVLKLADQLSAA